MRHWEHFVGGDLGEGQLVDEVVDQHLPGLLDSERGLYLFLHIFLALLHRRGSTLRQLVEIEKYVVRLFLGFLKWDFFLMLNFSVLDFKNTPGGSWLLFRLQGTLIR